MSENIRKENIKLKNYKDKLVYVYSHDFDYPYLACWGICSGFYSFIFLLVVGLLGLLGTDFDYVLMDFIVILAEVVCVTDFLAWKFLHDGVRDKIRVKRRIFWISFLFFVTIIGIIILIYNDWIFRFGDISVYFLVSVLVTYIPVVWLLGVAIGNWVKISYYRVLCYIQTGVLKALLEI